MSASRVVTAPAERAGNGVAPGHIGGVTRSIHWATAGLLLCGFGAAWIFNNIGHGRVAATLVEFHRTVGLSILGLTAARIIWRIVRPLPPLPSQTPLWETLLARGVQVLLYAALISMPIIGWWGSSADGDSVSFLGFVPLPTLTEPNQDLADRVFQLHAMVGYAILALLALHISGALRHHMVKHDGVLTRMVSGDASGSG